MDELINPIKCTEPCNYYFDTEIKPELKLCTLKFNEDIKIDDSVVKLEENHKKKLDENECKLGPKQPLTTKDAVKYLLEGNLKEKVCRYCLNNTLELSNLDELVTIARNGTLFSVAIKQMLASFHPVRITDDPNFPNKICQACLDQTINSYLFTQQCNQSERALRDCFEDMYEKVLKLDPLERTKRRGRYKLKPNHNVLHTKHKYVINYAEPTIHINSTSIQLPNEPNISDLECLKCSQILPDTITLLNHVKSHPKSQWFNCRLCGKSFPKLFQLKKHFRQSHSMTNTKIDDKSFKCKDCGNVSENYQQFYQHKEKHKFRNVMKHLLCCKMDKLCTICLDKGSHMIGIDENVNLFGGFPELTGDKSVMSMVTATLPEKNYKYQELYIARNANKITIRKKITSKGLNNYILSQPIILSFENINVNDDFIYLFNAPRKINEENDLKEPEAKKMRYDDGNRDKDILMGCNNLNEYILVDSYKDLNKIITQKYIYTFSKPIKISKINDLNEFSEESIKKSCKDCWIFPNSCAKCDGSKVESKTKCNHCWIFEKLEKCDNCKKDIERGKKNKIKGNADENKDKKDLPKDIEANKDTNNKLNVAKNIIIDDIKLNEKNPWQCAVCLTYNKAERDSCFCCESKTYTDNTNFNFSNTASFRILDNNSKKDSDNNSNNDSNINKDYLTSENVNSLAPTNFEGNITKNEPENTVNDKNLTPFTNFGSVAAENTHQNTVKNDAHIEMDTESADCAHFEKFRVQTFETKLESRNWEPFKPETVESMDIEELSMDEINIDIQKSDFHQAPTANFGLTKPVQFAIGSGEKIIRKRPFRKVARACHK